MNERLPTKDSDSKIYKQRKAANKQSVFRGYSTKGANPSNEAQEDTEDIQCKFQNGKTPTF